AGEFLEHERGGGAARQREGHARFGGHDLLHQIGDAVGAGVCGSAGVVENVGDHTVWGCTTVNLPVTLPVLRVPAGSNRRTCTSPAARGRCSRPRGTITNSPSPISRLRSAPDSSR